MLTMMDEIFDRAYRESRAELNASFNRALGQLGHAIDNAFTVLQRIEYNSPWTHRKTRSRAKARAH